MEKIGLLLDIFAQVGIEAMAQVDLHLRQNRHRPLEELAPMAAAVTAVVAGRRRRAGRLAGHHTGRAEWPERPPLASLHALEHAA